ncbi:MAG: HU family DNA-binding protein [Tannerella sp.]|jgi:predicted histone-like DNA-binding protein|nr:HU family DNA-binding protein [Tannerella sp.]
MPIFFNRVLRGKPGNPDSEKKWYLILKSVGLIRTNKVARLLADETTLNHKEAEVALVQAGKIMGRLLSDGHTVDLEGLGSFFVTANSTASDTKEGVSSRNVKSLNIRFTPCKELKQAVAESSLKPADSIGLNSE